MMYGMCSSGAVNILCFVWKFSCIKFQNGDQNGSAHNSDHKENNMATQEQFCDVAETMAVPEDVQQFWDNQSDGLKYYLSTLAPEHVNTVVLSAARPVVKKTVMDQRYGKNSF